MTKKTPEKFVIDGTKVSPGSRVRVNMAMGSLYNMTEIKMPVEIVRGKRRGPTLFVSSTIHGDEINGIEIVRRLLTSKRLKNMKGMLIAIPVVNVFGFNDRSRYLPDGRDLNRCFPGLKSGSLASQVAHKFMQEIVSKSDFGIDLHTGAFHRKNYPQIRANIDDERTLALAKIFGAPVIVNSNLRDGSLRAVVAQSNIPMILFEAGEALRFNRSSINVGVEGVLNFMTEIGMIKKQKKSKEKERIEPFIARSSSWIRAPSSGIHIPKKRLGKIIKKGDVLGEISSPFGDVTIEVKANETGMIIGTSLLPLVNKGDAVFHIASEEMHRGFEEINQQSLRIIENLDSINV